MAAEGDTKDVIERVSDDLQKPTDPGHGSSGHKLEPPPLVAAMSQEYRLELEKSMRRKVDTRLLPMIILMYISTCIPFTGGCTSSLRPHQT